MKLCTQCDCGVYRIRHIKTVGARCFETTYRCDSCGHTKVEVERTPKRR